MKVLDLDQDGRLLDHGFVWAGSIVYNHNTAVRCPGIVARSAKK